MTPIRLTSMTTRIFFWGLMAIAVLFLIPNFFQDTPVIEIHGAISPETLARVMTPSSTLRAEYFDDKVVIEAESVEQQLELYDQLKKALPDHQMNLNLRSQLPEFFQTIGLKPLKLGLDLRGGVHFLLQVETQSVIDKKMQIVEKQLIDSLQQKYQGVIVERQKNQRLLISVSKDDVFQKVLAEITQEYQQYQILPLLAEGQIELEPSVFYQQDEHAKLLQTTLTSLRQRISELGVAEASLYTQGSHDIVVDLPGIQDVHQAKELLGKTATVEFYLVSNKQLPPQAPVPPGVHRKKDSHGHIVDLVGRPLIIGQDIIMAQADTTPEGHPCVDLRISTAASRDFRRVTADNIGRFMAVVYVEFSTAEKWDELRQQWVAIPKTTEKVISVARIQSALGDRFQITGLSSQAALHTALMLRAGSLPAPVHIAEEKILGPSMGIENIRMGLASLLLGLTLIASFMTWYYRVLGLVTNLVLLCNLALLVMMLSLIQATLTLPGIAGIVLTLGMAVDANVIIFERVRDEMCRGVEAWRSLDIGLEKATETIMDSNITTMIIGVVLFFLGSGAVKGFAVTLVLGLVTSVFTALVGTRVCLRLFYRSDKQPDLRFLLPAASKESHS